MDLFARIALVIAAAAAAVWVLRRLKLSPIVGHLCLGVLVGPYALDLVPSTDLVQRLSEVGVIFLLFFIGLEFDLRVLRRTAALALGGATLQIALTTGVVGLAVATLLARPWQEALVIGLCGALSSTAVMLKVLADRKEEDAAHAQAALAISLGQDLIAMAAMTVAILVGAGGGGELLHIGLPLIGLPLLFFAARAILPRLFRVGALTQDQEGLALASLAACLLVAAAAHALGASLALGAFIGGMAFADTELAPQIRGDLSTVKSLGLGLFFLSVGMLVDLSYLVGHMPLIVGTLVGVVALKAVLATCSIRAFKVPWPIASGAGLALAPLSEFSFVLLSAFAGAVAISAETRQLIITVAVLSMLATPLLVALGSRFAHAAGADANAKGKPAEPVDPLAAVAGTRAVVVGYGPVGRTLCRILTRMGVKVCVIDLNASAVRKLRTLERDAIFGDAGRREVLEAAGLVGARYLIVTIPDLTSRTPIIATARSLAPTITILSRARYLDEQSALELAGADQISYEEAEVAVELARLALDRLGVEREVLEQEVSAIRSEIAVRTGFSSILVRPTDPSPPSAAPAPPPGA